MARIDSTTRNWPCERSKTTSLRTFHSGWVSSKALDLMNFRPWYLFHIINKFLFSGIIVIFWRIKLIYKKSNHYVCTKTFVQSDFIFATRFGVNIIEIILLTITTNTEYDRNCMFHVYEPNLKLNNFLKLSFFSSSKINICKLVRLIITTICSILSGDHNIVIFFQEKYTLIEWRYN